jgi:hypothetical protein
LQPRDAQEPQLSENVRSLAASSNLSQLLNAPEPVQPPEEIFGKPAVNSWCYFYEKADLAAQQKDWPAVIALQDAAQKMGFTYMQASSTSPHEWAPFIQAQAASGHMAQAERMLTQLVSRNPGYHTYLCAAWREVAAVSQSCANP